MEVKSEGEGAEKEGKERGRDVGRFEKRERECQQKRKQFIRFNKCSKVRNKKIFKRRDTMK